ncbi:FAD-dependent oxidoreductase [Desulfobacterales bacterium HSG16]|nr:FAD-dependent oxidoreductase [Desulfobacterales bacterium HSG16]
MNQNRQEVQVNNIKPVLVVGGGIAGIHCALTLAEMNHNVVLLEKSAALGGILPKLHRTYPDCACCRIYKSMLDAETHPNIRILTHSEITDVKQDGPQDWSVSISTRTKCIDPDKCIACGLCAEVCPQEVLCGGIESRKAAFIPYPQAVPYAYSIDTEECLHFKDDSCRECEKICPTGAISFSQQPDSLQSGEFVLNAGAVVLATGISATPDAVLNKYGYQQPNVFTALEFERLQSMSGPTHGRLVRPDNGTAPEKIAWIQCVGSRDAKEPGCGHCSSVCCMHAVKEAVGAKEKLGNDLTTDIFYMDLRAFGKGFEEYYNDAKARGVGFKRSRINEIIPPRPGTDRATVVYHDQDTNQVATGAYDMIVLSTGIQPPLENKSLIEQFGLYAGDSGFVETESLNPVVTPVPGLYVCGSLSGPKDIYDSMTEAGAAAGQAAAYMPLPARKTDVSLDSVSSPDTTRIGLFICSCPIDKDKSSIDKNFDLLKEEPGVEVLCLDEVLCNKKGRKRIVDIVEKNALNQLLVTSCAPTVHRALLEGTLKARGLENMNICMVDLTMLASTLIHKSPAEAEKSSAVIKTGLKTELKTELKTGMLSADMLKAQIKALFSRGILPAREASIKSTAALAVGASISGMEYALTLADKGIEVHLADARKSLTGSDAEMAMTWKDESLASISVQELITAVTGNPQIHLHLNAQVTKNYGYVGNFVSEITDMNTGKATTVCHGVTHIAPVTSELAPAEYLYGEHSGVVTLASLEKRLADPEEKLSKKTKNIVFIQCVGSREAERPYCSRTCCTRSLNLALKLKAMNPKLDITILFRDMRTFGLKELIYDKARKAGVVFIRYSIDDKPFVKSVDDNKLKAVVTEPLLNRKLVLEADMIVLAAAEVAQNQKLGNLFSVDLDKNGFFAESHTKMKPVQFYRQGITMSGAAHSPKFSDESISQAKAAAACALTILQKSTIPLENAIAQVTVPSCPVCCTCVRACPYGIPRIEGHVSVIDPNLCQGCGACASLCPGQYIKMSENQHQMACGNCHGILPAKPEKVEDAENFIPDIVLFSCGNCPAQARDRMISAGRKNPFAGLRVVNMPCMSRLDVEQLLEVFEQGADGIIVSSCSKDESCLHKSGTSSAENKVESIRAKLAEIGLAEDRIHFIAGSSSLASVFSGRIEAKTEQISQLGPSPLKKH